MSSTPYSLLLDGKDEDEDPPPTFGFVNTTTSSQQHGSLLEWIEAMEKRTTELNWVTDVPPMFTKHPKPKGFRIPGRRVGVPGHKTYSYLSNKQIWLSVCGSVWEIILKDSLFWGYLVAYAVTLILCATYNDSRHIVSKWPVGRLSQVYTLCIFTITFYLSNVFNKYGQRTQDMFKTNGSVSVISGIASGLVQWKEEQAKALVRYANAMLGLNYLSLSGPMTDVKWNILEYRGILVADEISLLKRAGGNHSTIVFSWSHNVINAAVAENVILPHQSDYILNHLGTIRGLSAKQLAYSFLQVPRPYFHLMWLASQTMLWVTIAWTGLEFGTLMRGEGCGEEYKAVHGEQICEAAAVWLVVLSLWLIIMVFALYKVSAYLSDPVGNGTSDYNLAVDLNNLWIESLRLLGAGARGLPGALANNPQLKDRQVLSTD